MQELERDAVRDVFEARIALPMPDDVGRGLLADRERRRSPQISSLFVPDIDGLARRIADRIVRPGRELVLAAIDRPRVPRTRLGDLEAETRVCDYIDPRRRRPPSLAEDRHVLASVRSKAAEWNVDKTRVAASGGSAGACTSLWLAFHPDLADPASADPIERESCVAEVATAISARLTEFCTTSV